MDALSEALRSVRITGAIFLSAEFRAPWCFETPPTKLSAPVLSPDTEYLVSYHLVTEGRASLEIPGEPVMMVEAGEVVVLPHGQAHLFYDGRARRPINAAVALSRHVAGELSRFSYTGGDGETSRFVCGFLGCDRHAERFFLAGLPAAIKVNIRSDATGAWIESSIRHLVDEAQKGQPGHAILLSKMAEALFIETLRIHLRTLPEDETGWLAAVRDPVSGAALALIHRRPAEAWTIERLAAEAGSSRAVLAERFHNLLGEPPITYLTRWRMQVAARKLRATTETVLGIALDVGYESEAAFSRAFKREFGTPPSKYRKSFLNAAAAAR